MNYRQEVWLSVFGAYYAICGGDGVRAMRVADGALHVHGDAVVSRLCELSDPIPTEIGRPDGEPT